eukprot:3831260-Amphidinium_carterae.1
MKQWSSWYTRLKNVSALLSNPDRMRRVRAVVQQGPLSHTIAYSTLRLFCMSSGGKLFRSS